MKKAILSFALALALVPSPAFAKGNPHDGKKDPKHHDRDDHHGWKNHKRDHRVSHNSGRPPGWDKGKKTGWGDCEVPPGQAKKVGCHSHSTRVTHTHHERRPVVTAPRTRRYPRSTTRYPRTTTTTTTTTQTTTGTKGTHPFAPVLRQKQSGGPTQAASTKQNIRY